jgi:hypothetical protein
MRVKLSGPQPLLYYDVRHDLSFERDLILDAESLTFASPLDLAVAGAWATRHALGAGSTRFVMPEDDAAASYIHRMDLVNALEWAGVVVEGRQVHVRRADRRDVLIELTPVCSTHDVKEFARRCYELVSRHIGLQEAVATFEMVAELLENAVEHANSPTPAFAAAQVYPTSRRLALGVADAGIGIRTHLTRNPKYASLETDATAIEWAMKPGVSGTNEQRGNGLDNLVKVAGRYGGYLLMRSGEGVGEIRVVRNRDVLPSFRATRFYAPGTWASLSASFP